MGNITAIVTVIAVLGLQLSVSVLAQTPASTQSQTVVGNSVINPQQTTISGTVMNPSGEILANVRVQARNLLTGQIGGSAKASGTGEYTITGLLPAYYVIEVVDDDSEAIIGTSGFISAPAGAAVTAAMVTATTGALTAATTAAATGIAATIGATAARGVSFMAAAAGVTGVVAPPEVPVASPSR